MSSLRARLSADDDPADAVLNMVVPSRALETCDGMLYCTLWPNIICLRLIVCYGVIAMQPPRFGFYCYSDTYYQVGSDLDITVQKTADLPLCAPGGTHVEGALRRLSVHMPVLAALDPGTGAHCHQKICM